jgi:endonuclease YncB( thermonuclease family)
MKPWSLSFFTARADGATSTSPSKMAATTSGLHVERDMVRPPAGHRLTRRVPLVLGFAIAAALGAALLVASAQGRTHFDARVVRVIDGDTLDVLADGERVRIRIFGIDTPERGQPWSRKARDALTRRVAGKDVRINEVETDDYGRLVGEVYADDVCVGCELVREGHAWVYRAYTHDPVLLQLEADAREHRRGLWALPEAERVPPWEWRHGRAPEADDTPKRSGEAE